MELISGEELRRFAREGAKLVAIAAVTEFPDILADLNALANGNGKPPRPRSARRRVPPVVSSWTGDHAPAPRRRLSADARRRISQAQKRRWAKKRRG